MALSQLLCFEFKDTRKQDEYKTFLVGLRLTKEFEARRVKCRSDSKIAYEQINKVF